MGRLINQAGLDLIKSFEGFRSHPYLDAVSVPTIGYGNTYYQDGSRVTLKDEPIDESRALSMLQNLLDKDFCPGVERLITSKVNDNQFSACVSLAYNIGLHNFEQSTVLRCTNFMNWTDAADAFLKWNKAGGVILPGLARRRETERRLYLLAL